MKKTVTLTVDCDGLATALDWLAFHIRRFVASPTAETLNALVQDLKDYRSEYNVKRIEQAAKRIAAAHEDIIKDLAEK